MTLPLAVVRVKHGLPALPSSTPQFVPELLAALPKSRASIARSGMRGLGQTATGSYAVYGPQIRPIYDESIPVMLPVDIPPGRIPAAGGPQYTADQLALIQAGVQNVTPATNPSELTPDQIAQIQSYQTVQAITASGGQLSPAQLESMQAYYQAQSFANSPYVSTAQAATPSSSFSTLISSIPTWGWIVGGAALIFLLRGRK